MLSEPAPHVGNDPLKAILIPRFQQQGFDAESTSARRDWIERMTGTALTHVGAYSVEAERMRGNIENPIGAVQVPVGVAGPLLVNGSHAKGIFYVPLATTEGALVRSYERGMVTLTRSGGANVRIYVDENRCSPVFLLHDVESAHDFSTNLDQHFHEIRKEAEGTTRHGKLLRLECHAVGREVMVNFCYFTGDAHGMNMIVKATERACQWIVRHTSAQRFYLFSGMASEKHASGFLFLGGKGKKVIAGAMLPSALVRRYLHVSPAEMVDLWHHTVLGHMQANALGYNGHYANGLTALFIACGQDVANVANSAVGITNFELVDGDRIYVSVTLPSLTVATVGGGTGLGTGRECLGLVGVGGANGACKFAEITAATLLAGEISIAAAMASGEFVAAHDRYGRNRPQP